MSFANRTVTASSRPHLRAVGRREMRYCLKCTLVVWAILTLSSLSESWWSRRRRRYRCSATNCKLSDWGSWTSCSATCGGGTQNRSRRKISSESCGGSCSSLKESRKCNTGCCPVNCAYSWSAWSACGVTCQQGTKQRTPTVSRNPSCGGASCPGTQTKSCNTNM